MTFIYLIICFIIILLIFKKVNNKKASPIIVHRKKLSESNIGGIVKITAVETLVDVSPIKHETAKRIIKKFRKPYSIEQKIIIDSPISFIYFVRFFDSSIRYGETKPLYITTEDPYRKRYEQAHKYGLALRGKEIPVAEILNSLRLKKELNQISDKQFTRIKPAIEYLLQLPDIDLRLNKFSPRENYFQLKNLNLDMDFLNEQWEIINGEC